MAYLEVRIVSGRRDRPAASRSFEDGLEAAAIRQRRAWQDSYSCTRLWLASKGRERSATVMPFPLSLGMAEEGL